MSRFAKFILMVAAVIIPSIAGMGSIVSYARSISPVVISKASVTTVPFRTEKLSKVSKAVTSWVNEKSAESGTFSMKLAGRTYILVSRGWQAGSRGVKVERVRRVKHSTIQVQYYDIDPAPGQLDSHVMAKRFALISIPGTYEAVRFAKIP